MLDFGLAQAGSEATPAQTPSPRHHDRRGAHRRHVRLHVARAGARRAGRCALRRLRAGRRASTRCSRAGGRSTGDTLDGDPVVDHQGRATRRSRRSGPGFHASCRGSSATAWRRSPARRKQSALDVRNELEDLKREIDSGELAAVAQPARRRRRGAAQGLVGRPRRRPASSRWPDLPAGDGWKRGEARTIRLTNPRQVTFTSAVETSSHVVFRRRPDRLRLGPERQRRHLGHAGDRRRCRASDRGSFWPRCSIPRGPRTGIRSRSSHSATVAAST